MEKEQKGKEVAELQTRLSVTEQREEERGREVFTLKQKLTDSETTRDSLKKEVRITETGQINLLRVDPSTIFFPVAVPGSETSVGLGVQLEGL